MTESCRARDKFGKRQMEWNASLGCIWTKDMVRGNEMEMVMEIIEDPTVWTIGPTFSLTKALIQTQL